MVGVLMLRSWTTRVTARRSARWLMTSSRFVNWRSDASVAFSVTDRPSTRLCCLRSSATRPSPSRMASCGEANTTSCPLSEMRPLRLSGG